ncbi:MAG: sugar ABC transporter permease [Anaerolineae bacterium]|nr:sugar ABC transporter permease [Candidatus Roseilinea sp.]MDW8450075.1 sugar ABC transporter permease [Anaerolineae bacterium]
MMASTIRHTAFTPRFTFLNLMKREKLPGWALILPTLLIVAGVTLGPLLYAGWLSLHEVGLDIRANMHFVGLANYVDIVQSPTFRNATGRTLYFAVVSLALQIPLGLAIALLLNQSFHGRSIVRALILLPWAIPTIVNGALWQWIYNASYGALNGLLYQLGIIHAPVVWLGSASLAMNMVILADTWKVLPYYAVLFLAGLQTIPRDLYDAASVDGASVIGKLRHVILPSLKPFLLVILIVRTMETFRVFDIIYMLTSGGPGGATTVIGYYTYQLTFLSLQFGYGSALSFTIGAVTLLIAIMYIRILRTEETLD